MQRSGIQGPAKPTDPFPGFRFALSGLQERRRLDVGMAQDKGLGPMPSLGERQALMALDSDDLGASI